MGGGGAAELKDHISGAGSETLGTISSSIGRTAVLGEEDAWLAGNALCHRRVIAELARPLVTGEDVRNWCVRADRQAIYPYLGMGGMAVDALPAQVYRRLWPNRTLLTGRTVFKRTMTEMGKHWYELLEHYRGRFSSPLTIAGSEIATHTHFAMVHCLLGDQEF